MSSFYAISHHAFCSFIQCISENDCAFSISYGIWWDIIRLSTVLSSMCLFWNALVRILGVVATWYLHVQFWDLFPTSKYCIRSKASCLTSTYTMTLAPLLAVWYAQFEAVKISCPLEAARFIEFLIFILDDPWDLSPTSNYCIRFKVSCLTSTYTI